MACHCVPEQAFGPPAAHVPGQAFGPLAAHVSGQAPAHMHQQKAVCPTCTSGILCKKAQFESQIMQKAERRAAHKPTIPSERGLLDLSCGLGPGVRSREGQLASRLADRHAPEHKLARSTNRVPEQASSSHACAGARFGCSTCMCRSSPCANCCAGALRAGLQQRWHARQQSAAQSGREVAQCHH